MDIDKDKRMTNVPVTERPVGTDQSVATQNMTNERRASSDRRVNADRRQNERFDRWDFERRSGRDRRNISATHPDAQSQPS